MNENLAQWLIKKLLSWIETLYWQTDRLNTIVLSESVAPWWATKIREHLHRLDIVNHLGWPNLILTVLLLPIAIYNIIRAATSKEDKVINAVTIVKTIGNITLATVALFAAAGLVYLTAPILFTVIAAKSIIENGIILAKQFYNRFINKEIKSKNINALKQAVKTCQYKLSNTTSVSESQQVANQLASDLQKLTELTNKRRKSNQETFNTTHALIQSGAMLVGAILLFIAPPVGIIVLLATITYGLLDPIKYIGQFANFISQKIRKKPLFDPFREKSSDEIYDEIKNDPSITPDLGPKENKIPEIAPDKKNPEYVSNKENPKHGEPGHVHGSEIIMIHRFIDPEPREKLMNACKQLSERCKQNTIRETPASQATLGALKKYIKKAEEIHEDLTKEYSSKEYHPIYPNPNKAAQALTMLIEEIDGIIKHTNENSAHFKELKTNAQNLAEKINPEIKESAESTHPTNKK